MEIRESDIFDDVEGFKFAEHTVEPVVEGLGGESFVRKVPRLVCGEAQDSIIQGLKEAPRYLASETASTLLLNALEQDEEVGAVQDEGSFAFRVRVTDPSVAMNFDSLHSGRPKNPIRRFVFEVCLDDEMRRGGLLHLGPCCDLPPVSRSSVSVLDGPLFDTQHLKTFGGPDKVLPCPLGEAFGR